MRPNTPAAFMCWQSLSIAADYFFPHQSIFSSLFSPPVFDFYKASATLLPAIAPLDKFCTHKAFDFCQILRSSQPFCFFTVAFVNGNFYYKKHIFWTF